MHSTYQSFAKFLALCIVVIVLLVSHQHQLIKRTTSSLTTLASSGGGDDALDFESIVVEYKKSISLKSERISTAGKSKQTFAKLVQEYKESAPRQLLNQLYQRASHENQEVEVELKPEEETRVVGAIIQPKASLQTAETTSTLLKEKANMDGNIVIMQSNGGSAPPERKSLDVIKLPPDSDLMRQWHYISKELQNVTKTDHPNPYVRWVDRWEPLPDDFRPNEAHLGVNKSVTQPLLVYNKVPRCGSGVMQTIIKDVMSKLNYTFDHLPSSNMLLNSYMELDIFQQMYTKAAISIEKSMGYAADCYFNFVDVGVYGLPREAIRPNWINVVREPISRYISHFYYMSRDWRMQNKVLSPEDAKRFAGVDLDSCLKRNGDPCQFFCLQYEFFCGNSMACRREDKSSVLRAMYNAEKYFSVLGLTEDLDMTFRLLEALLPRFFLGATQAFRNRSKRDGDGKVVDQYRENVTDHPDLSEEAKTILKEHVHFSREIEFYEFAKQRFYFQVEKVLK